MKRCLNQQIWQQVVLLYVIQNTIKSLKENYCLIKTVCISKPPFIDVKVKILKVLIQL